MELWVLLSLLAVLLFASPFARGVVKLWVIASLVLVWLLDRAADSVLGD